MNGNQPDQRPKKNAAAGKGKAANKGNRKRSKKQGKKKQGGPALDPGRSLWENSTGESELRDIVGSVRPAENPTALVGSLGDPPLGRFAGNAHHYYEAVYEKAQRFAVAMATANGLRVIDPSDDDPSDDEAGGPTV